MVRVEGAGFAFGRGVFEDFDAGEAEAALAAEEGVGDEDAVVRFVVGVGGRRAFEVVERVDHLRAGFEDGGEGLIGCAGFAGFIEVAVDHDVGFWVEGEDAQGPAGEGAVLGVLFFDGFGIARDAEVDDAEGELGGGVGEADDEVFGEEVFEFGGAHRLSLDGPAAGGVEDGADVLAGGGVSALREEGLVLALVPARCGVGEGFNVFVVADFLEADEERGVGREEADEVAGFQLVIFGGAGFVGVPGFFGAEEPVAV